MFRERTKNINTFMFICPTISNLVSQLPSFFAAVWEMKISLEVVCKQTANF
jgi:hypothetical protein